MTFSWCLEVQEVLLGSLFALLDGRWGKPKSRGIQEQALGQMRRLSYSRVSQKESWGGVGPGGGDQCITEVATVYMLEIIY